MERYKDVFLGIFLMAVGFVLFAASFSIKSVLPMEIGPDFFPRVAAVCLIVLGAGTTGECLLKVKKEGNGQPEQEEKQGGSSISVVLTIVLMVIYVVVIKKMGFLITTALYLFCQINILAPKEKRNQILFIVISAAASAVIYLAFAKGLNLLLPAGILG